VTDIALSPAAGRGERHPWLQPSRRRGEELVESERRARARHERLLFKRYRERRDSADRDALIERFLPLANVLAARFWRNREPFDDLYQVACVGLVKAIDRFDVSRGNAFSSYAVPTILGELKRYFRDRTWPVGVPRDLKDLALRVERARQELSGPDGRPPTVAHIARALGLQEEEVLDAHDAMKAYEPMSLEGPRFVDEEDQTTIGDSIGDEERGYWRVEDAAGVEGLLRFLTPRQQEVVRLRFTEELTQREIGERVGVSQMQVSRILREAIERLREIARCDRLTDRV
jgi:RNA polymerase sigma-B factor